jgi:hypothetical protein
MSTPTAVRRRVGRLGVVLAAVGLAAGLTVGVARSTAASAFTASTGDTSNKVTAAASFCVAPGTTSTVTSAGDSWTDEAAPTTNHGGDPALYVRSSSTGDRRTWVRFNPPAPPTHCRVASAQLRLYARTPTPGRTIEVYRGLATAPAWTSTGITWATQPSAVGPAASSSSLVAAGWQTWNVTAHVQDQYANGRNGFVLQDSSENAGVAVDQVYDDLQTPATAPTLVVTWG